MSVALAVLSAASIAYGVTIQMVGSGTWFFAFWYVLGAALLGAGAALHLGAWEALPAAARHVMLGVAAVALAGFCAAGAFVASGFGAQGEDELDYMVVLGAQVRESGPSTVLRYRLDAAADYLERNPGTVCIVSGGQGPNEPMPEAQAMASYLVDAGIDPARIVEEGASLNTAQNIRNSLALMDAPDARVGIVTNDFHVARATGIARKLGMVNACGIAAGCVPWYLPNNFVRETLGVAKDLLAGNL